MSKKIYITGCAKSGTTLLLRMCYAFEDVDILYQPGDNGHEISFEEFANRDSQSKYIIGKRHPPSILSNKWESSFEEQLKRIREEDIFIINVIRDGRDVVLSDGNYVTPQRWISCVQQRAQHMYGAAVGMEIRYEDLVSSPDEIQVNMETKTGLKSKHKFSDYPKYVEDWVYDWNVSVLARAGRGNEEKYGKREISLGSIGRDTQAYKKICDPTELGVFEECLKQLNYI